MSFAMSEPTALEWPYANDTLLPFEDSDTKARTFKILKCDFTLDTKLYDLKLNASI